MFQKRNDLEIVLVLLNEEMHLRGIATKINLSPSTVMRLLNDLPILDYRTQGKNKIYSLKNIPETKQYILMAEHYKLLKALENPKIRWIYKEITSLTNEMIIVFGSYASNTMKTTSDLDLYVETSDNLLMKDIRKISDKISLQTGKLNKDSAIYKEIQKNHLILQNAERFYQEINI